MLSESKQVKEYCDLAMSAYFHDEYDRAIKYCDQAISLDNCCARAYNSRGVIKLDQGFHEDALADFSQAIFINPIDCTFYYNRGLVKDVLSDIGRIHDFNLAITLNPNYQSAYLKRGSAKHELKLYLEAIDDYNQAIAISTNNDEVFYHRAVTKLALGNTQSALADLDRAIELNPKYVYNYTLKAEIFMEIGEKAAANSMLERAYDVAPSEPLIYYINSQLLISDKAYDLAIEQLIQLADLHIARHELNYYNRTIRDIKILEKSLKPSP